MFVTTKYSLLRVVSLPLALSFRMLREYQQVEREIWGKVELLPDEQMVTTASPAAKV